MGQGNFSEECKRDTVAQISELGIRVAEASKLPGCQSALALRMGEEVLAAFRRR